MTDECRVCGRDRPDRSERWSVTLSDYADSTAAFEKFGLCAECWRRLREELRAGRVPA
jgi:hypothetical protein